MQGRVEVKFGFLEHIAHVWRALIAMCRREIMLIISSCFVV
jgi:hypothetical protein